MEENNNSYTRVKISFNMDKKLKKKIDFIGKLQHRDTTGQINYVIEKYVKKYVKKHNLESDEVKIEGLTFSEFVEGDNPS